MARKSKTTSITGADMLKLRKGMGKNQLEFWSPLGVSQSGGSRYESGRAIPRPTRRLIYLMYLAGIPLDLSVREVLEGL